MVAARQRASVTSQAQTTEVMLTNPILQLIYSLCRLLTSD